MCQVTPSCENISQRGPVFVLYWGSCLNVALNSIGHFTLMNISYYKYIQLYCVSVLLLLTMHSGREEKTFTLGRLFSPSSGRVHFWNFVLLLKVDDPLVAGLHVVWSDCSSFLQCAIQPVKNCVLFLLLIHRAPGWITLSSADKTDSCIVYSFPHRFVLELPPHIRMWTFVPEDI